MNTLKAQLIPLPIFYDPGRSNWCLYPQEKSVVKEPTLYWGGSPTPLNIRVHHSLVPPAGALPMKALVRLGNRPLLGPLIGILSAENRDGSLKGNFANYKDIMEAGQKAGGIVFAFTPSSVDWKKRTIRGILYDKSHNQWVPCPFPFPNVVYNRIQDRNHERQESSQICIRRFLASPEVALYNRGFFNKEKVISVLRKSPKLRKYIPETNPLLSKADLIRMLMRHKALYLKPTDNRLGSGIIRVIKPPANMPYMMHYYAQDKLLKEYSTDNILQLWHKIRQQMISSQYIVQKAVPLAVVSKCPFDCRVLVQKNRLGLWQISGLGIRVAAHPQSITTHVPRGGHIEAPGYVLEKAFPQQNPVQMVKRVHRLCVAAAKKLEQHDHLLGEMSIDVGLDQNGHPWIFEANAKPMKFDEPIIRNRQLLQVIRYAQFLTFKDFS